MSPQIAITLNGSPLLVFFVTGVEKLLAMAED